MTWVASFEASAQSPKRKQPRSKLPPAAPGPLPRQLPAQRGSARQQSLAAAAGRDGVPPPAPRLAYVRVGHASTHARAHTCTVARIHQPIHSSIHTSIRSRRHKVACQHMGLDVCDMCLVEIPLRGFPFQMNSPDQK